MNYQRRDWMSDDQFEAYKLLADLAGGDHHLAKVKEFGAGVETNIRCDLATFDFNQLFGMFQFLELCIINFVFLNISNILPI